MLGMQWTRAWLCLWRNVRRIFWLLGRCRSYDLGTYWRLGLSRRHVRNLRGWRSRLMWITRWLWRGGSSSFRTGFGSFHRNDVECYAVLNVHKTCDHILDVVRSDIEIVVQLGIDEPRI